MPSLKASSGSLGVVDAALACAIVDAAADVALCMDADGIIRDLAYNPSVLGDKNIEHYVGKRWNDTVTVESQHKVDALLASVSAANEPGRQINQIGKDGAEFLVAFRTVSLADGRGYLAVGHDLGSLTRMQQRLVNVQQSMERDYTQLRDFETRYRLLLQTAGEATIIVNAHTLEVLEANPAACEVLNASERKLVGSRFLRWVEDANRQRMEDALAAVRSEGMGKRLSVDLTGEESDLVANLSYVKSDNYSHVLIRLCRRQSEHFGDVPREFLSHHVALVNHVPDALVVTNSMGMVVTVNTEFLDLAQLPNADAARDRSLSDWLGHSGIDYQVIMASLRENGSIRLFNTQMRGEFGTMTEVEVSASLIDSDEFDGIGFAVRNITRRIAANDEVAPSSSPRSIDQMTQLVGRVPLKELVRESTELIEQMCIEAALRLTGNNRASAAEMLGLSRQSLYVKLRRYSLDDVTESDTNDDDTDLDRESSFSSAV